MIRSPAARSIALEEATDEIVLIALEEDPSNEAVLETLAEASDRDVAIHVGTIIEPVGDRIDDARSRSGTP